MIYKLLVKKNIYKKNSLTNKINGVKMHYIIHKEYVVIQRDDALQHNFALFTTYLKYQFVNIKVLFLTLKDKR